MWYGESFKLKKYYLFMLSDGRCSDGENDKFDSICRVMKVDDKNKQEVIDYCNKVMTVFSDDNSTMITAEISKLLPSRNSMGVSVGVSVGLSTGVCSSSSSKSEEAEIIWNLINLAYSDGEYSEPEKRVVAFLVNCWKIDDATFSDFIDTAETMLALEKEKQWLKKAGRDFDKTVAKIHGIDDTISRLAQNVNLLISEADLEVK